MTHQTIPGRKASLTKLFAWGPDEASRAARDAAWRADHPEEPIIGNPYTRDAVYTAAEKERALSFYVWHACHVTGPSLDDHITKVKANPHAHPDMLARYRDVLTDSSRVRPRNPYAETMARFQAMLDDEEDAA